MSPPLSNETPVPVVSILVVSYNTREMTLECLRSVFEQTTRTSFELIVVDNQSGDGSAEAIETEFGDRISLIRAKSNLGFAAANNLAAELARGEYLLLLNPDTVILEGAIDKLLRFSHERPEAKIWGGRTVYADGSLNATNCFRQMSLWTLTCRALALTVLLRHSELFNPECYAQWQRDRERDVGVITGCFLLIKRDFWNRLRGFDQSFFMYAEEADLCQRAALLGAKPMMTPNATIIHHGSASDPDRAEKAISVFRGKVTLMRRHWSTPARLSGIGLLIFLSVTRDVAYFLAGCLTGSPAQRAKGKLWRQVWMRTSEWARGYPICDQPND